MANPIGCLIGFHDKLRDTYGFVMCSSACLGIRAGHIRCAITNKVINIQGLYLYNRH